jgi:hypothetical protein
MFAAPAADGLRDRFLRALVLFSASLFLITESLGGFQLIGRLPLLTGWIVIAVIAVIARIST